MPGSARPPARASRFSTYRARGPSLVHVHNDPEELGRVYQADLPILAGMDPFAEAVATLEPPAARPWADATREAHAEELAWRAPTRIPGGLQLGEVVAWLRERLAPDTILTNGAGNYAIWANRHFAYHGLGTQLAPTSGSMGYGLPAAVAAKLAHPDRPVVCFAGDGCFLMTGQELATAVQYELPILVIVVDNSMYGTIRMHQEREHPGRVSGTPLRNPDFAALARAYGAFGARVESTEAFAPAFEEALASGPACFAAPDPRSRGDHAAHDAHRHCASRRGPSGAETPPAVLSRCSRFFWRTAGATRRTIPRAAADRRGYLRRLGRTVVRRFGRGKGHGVGHLGALRIVEVGERQALLLTPLRHLELGRFAPLAVDALVTGRDRASATGRRSRCRSRARSRQS